MKIITTLAVSGAALLLLAGAGNATGQSTPQERAEAQQPNLEQAPMAQQQNAGLDRDSATTSYGADTSSNGGTTLAPVALNSLTNPPDKIATARVVDDKGFTVGAAQKVELDTSGKPSKVEFALLGTEEIVALDSSMFSYDEPKNVLTAGMDKSQIVQLRVTPRG